jgi:hypothetical protein
MSDVQNLESDISFLKKLASSGRGKPAPMAMLLAGFGLIFGLLFLYEWSLLRLWNAGALSKPELDAWMGTYMVRALPVLLVLLLLASVVQAWMRRGQGAQVHHVAAAGWTGAALGLLTITASFVIFSGVRNNYYAMNILPAVALVLWGMAWFVSAAATGQKWLYTVTAGSLIAALAWSQVALFSPDGFLVAALSFLLLAFVPGAILMWQGRR